MKFNSAYSYPHPGNKPPKVEDEAYFPADQRGYIPISVQVQKHYRPPSREDYDISSKEELSNEIPAAIKATRRKGAGVLEKEDIRRGVTEHLGLTRRASNKKSGRPSSSSGVSKRDDQRVKGTGVEEHKEGKKDDTAGKKVDTDGS